MRYDESFDEPEWREHERAALDALPRERPGTHLLRERTLRALRRDGMLRPRSSALRRVGLYGLAASVVFVAGGIAGSAVALRTTESGGGEPRRATRVALDTSSQTEFTVADSVRHVVWF